MGLEFYSSPTGAGIGTGTVTSVGTSSNSLVNNSAPNPITTVGTVSFEVQIIDITKAAAVIANGLGNLLPGVTYRITDFNKVIGAQTLLTADFFTDKQSLLIRKMCVSGMAFDAAGEQYFIKYDLATDFLMEVYYPPLDQRAERQLGSTANCITALKWKNAGWAGTKVIETNFLSVGTSQCSNVVAFMAQIDFGGFNGSISNAELQPNSSISFQALATLNALFLNQDAVLSPSKDITGGFFGIDSSFSNVSAVKDVYVGNKCIVSADGTKAPALNNWSADFNNNAPVQVLTSAAIAEQIVSCYNTQIFVNVDPSHFAVGYSVNLPQYPIDKQVVNIGFNSACATATGVVTATFAAGITVSILATQKGQCVSYIFDLATNTWYLV